MVMLAVAVGCGESSYGTTSPALPVYSSGCGYSLQARIDVAEPGDIVEAGPCIHREQIVIEKPLTLAGQPGSEIRGSDVWGEWEEAAGGWVSSRTLPEFPQTTVECIPGTERCLWPEQVFLDGEPLRQVSGSPSAGEFAVDEERRIFLGENPEAHSVEVTVRRFWVLGKSEDVVVRGFVMKHAANGGRSGAVMNRTTWKGDGYPGWKVKDNTLSDAHGAVVSLTGATDLAILDNDISHGGQLGIKSTGPGQIIERNRIHHNNTELFNWRWEAGGLKTSGANSVTVASNEFHDNEGNAIWFDVDSHDNSIQDNRIHHNARHGIHYELSARGDISGNVLWENGWSTPDWVHGSAVSSANSTNTDIYRNTLAWNADGISVIGLDRDGTKWDSVERTHVFENQILAEDSPDHPLDRFALAWLQGWSDRMFENDSRNRGWDNLYWFPDTERDLTRYEWAKEKYTSLEEFSETPGDDGRYLTTEEKDTVISEMNLPPEPEEHSENKKAEQPPENTLGKLVLFLDWITHHLSNP